MILLRFSLCLTFLQATFQISIAQEKGQMVRLARLEIDSAQLENYKSFLVEEIETSLQVEPGVLTLYAVSEKDNPTNIAILEVYQDHSAYQSHIQSPHFIKYKTATLEMVKSLELMETIPLVHSLKFDQRVIIPQENTPANGIFPQGNLGPAENFTGNAWVTGLVENDAVYETVAASVTFEAGARTNWHSHPSGQLMLVTDGVGYHQIKGQAKQTIRKGDVVKCPPNTLHWHGGSKESSMTHVVVLPNTERGMVTWMEEVSDEEYLR